jgi:hypothetical protein
MENQHHNDSNGRSPFRARHFAERIDENRRLLRLVCEAQPLITLTSYDLPKRCPLCGQNYPIKIVGTRGEQDAHQQG